MTILWKLSKKQLAWLPGSPERRTLLLHMAVWFLMGGGAACLIGCILGHRLGWGLKELVLAAGNLGGICALAPGLYGGLYWYLNREE